MPQDEHSKTETDKGQGLNTVHDLTWSGRIRLAMRRQSRRIYRSIRHPKHRRRGRIRAWLANRIHNRDLWRMRRHSLANGVAGGMFIAMLPIPAQSVVAAAAGIARGWNLPAAIVCTWVSNPLTYLPIFYASKKCVTVAYNLFGAEPTIHELTPANLRDLDYIELVKLITKSGPEFVIGTCLLGILCAIAGFLLVHAVWHLFAHLAQDPVADRRDARIRERDRRRRRRASPTTPG